MGLHMVIFDFDLQGHLGQKLSKCIQNGLVHSITFARTYLESPNLVCSPVYLGKFSDRIAYGDI